MPVDVYVAGCPPTPEALIDELILIQKPAFEGKPRKRNLKEYLPEVVRDPSFGRPRS